MTEPIVGIDLGTTNSEIAIVENGKPRVIAVDGDPILPSVVGFDGEGKLLVGKAARNQYVLAPERTVKSIKRSMGQDVKVTVGEQQYRPQEISAMILRRLKEAAEADLKKPVKKAVITVPAYFNDTQRQSTREAGELAGLEVVRILNEPTAAALTYRPDPAGSERFLVYDLGGGTFDVSIVQAEGGVFEVLSSHGDTQLGGDDFDELLLNDLADDFRTTYGVDLRESRTARARLLRAVENAKKALSDHAVAKIEEEFIAEKDGVPLHFTAEIERGEFEALIRPLIDRTMQCVQLALNDAKVTAAMIQQVVLVGGSTRTPLIGRLLEENLGQPAHREVHPDLCVAMGAAVQAAIIGGESVGAVLVDITPHSLGIKSLEIPASFQQHFNEFKFAPIVRRNTPLPASRSEIFGTVSDGQPTVEIDVFQGESGDVRRNHRVGKFLIEGLAKVPAGNQIVVQMDVTLDGTLQVTAREKSTGLKKQITIENAMARFAIEERDAAKERLDRLWAKPDWNETDGDEESEPLSATDFTAEIEDGDEEGEEWKNGRDEADEYFDGPPEPAEAPPSRQPRVRLDAPVSGPPSPVESAKSLLAKAEALATKANDDDRAELDRLIASVRTHLDGRNADDLQAAVGQLGEVLFYLEDA